MELLNQLIEIQYNLRFFSSERTDRSEPPRLDLFYDLLRHLSYKADEGVDMIDGMVEHAEELIVALKKLKTLVKEQ
jgi:hypothetical protein